MSTKIPDYYRDLATDGEPGGGDEDGSSSASDGSPDGTEAEDPETRTYRADSFRCRLPVEGWTDRSEYTFTGPTADGVTHDISITTVEGLEGDDVSAFAQAELERLTARLDGCQPLMDGPFTLAGDRPAHRVLFFWFPDASLKLYQEQLYTIHEATGYVLSAGFTASTRKQIGGEVEDMMRSFRPGADTPRAPFPGPPPSRP